ncbi:MULTISPECIES: homoserine kinase [Caldimonas]|uniref:homoserine kinase n=1 Tax=Caldimonas TaxID=196013 RepID=UPI00036F25A7|nr:MULTISPECIES: homoserine kinase [Caldimonas]MCX7660084.1 homoserine kinase [Caldimonas manganoxidans]GIX23219.1 MAG: homoserine kinase [Caldimonas sp.]
MAVFTTVTPEQAADLVQRLNLGRLVDLRGIASGIENTNYFLTAERAGQCTDYVLTLFERLSFEQLPFYLHLMKHLAARGIPVPDPKADANGEILHTVCGKPAAVVDRLRGGHQLAPSHEHCRQVGQMLARMHLAGRDYPRYQPNLRGLDWWVETAPSIMPHLDAAQRQLLESELAFQCAHARSAAYLALPRGPIHADLFRDNVMFEGDTLTGFFDFYFAGVDTFLFDIAVCLNDWCTDLDSGRLDEARATTFVDAYRAVRPLSHDEVRLMPALLRAGALRFWISRLWDYHLPRDAHMLKAHDPGHFERILRARVDTPWHPEP